MTKFPSEPRRILIVDDDQKVLDLLVELLELEGYEVSAARDGASALDLLTSCEQDLVVSDVVMPVLDGIELCRHIKQDPRTANIPVLLMSGSRKTPDDSIEGLTAGADDYLEIPFRHEALLVKVARLTERHRVEKHYREIVEQAADMIYTRTMDGYITSINPAGARFFNRPVSHLIGVHLSELIGPEAAALDIDETSRFNSDSPARSLHCLLDEQGQMRYLEGMITVERDHRGQPIRVRGVVRDITEQKLAEEALKESEERYRRLVELSPDAIVLILELKIIYLNRAAQHLWGASSGDELIGRSILDVIHPDYRDLVSKRIRDINELGEPSPLNEQKHLKLNGEVIDVEVTGMPFTFRGQPAIQAVIRDVTERKRARESLRQAEERQAQREEMTHRISQAVRCSLDSSEIFQTAVRELGSYLKVDRCSLFVKDEDARHAINVAEYHAEGVEPAATNVDLADLQGLAESLEQNGVLVINDAARDERVREVYQRILSRAGVRSIMYVAIRVGDDVPAAFALSTTREMRDWSESDITLSKAIADQTGIAIRQSELYQKAEATSSREALVNRLTSAIRASLSLPEVLSTATRELGGALSASRVYLHLYNPENPVSPVEHEFVALGCTGVNKDASYDDPVGRYLLGTLKPLVIDDALNYSGGPAKLSAFVRAHARTVNLRSQIDYPLIVKGHFRGVICIHQTDRQRHWTDDELSLVEAVAARLAIGISQAELFEMVARGKQEWETTFDAMSDGIFIFDKAGDLMRVNRAGAAMEHSHPSLLRGRKCCDILRTSAEDETCVVERALEDKESVTIEITPAGGDRPLLVSIEPLLDEDNKTTGAVCTARDLSELRKVEAVAREHQSLLTHILESARESIYAVDSEGRFKWCNSATLIGVGYKREEFIGRRLLDLVYEGDRELVSQKLAAAMNGQAQTYQMRYFSPNGELRYARVDNSPLVVDGHTTGVLGIARDITEQKEERERAARADKLRALGQLASGVAHDFNNSLAAILGRAQLLRRQTNDDALVRNLDIIQTAAEDAAATVRRIQTFARKAPAKEFEIIDVRSLLVDAVEITRTRWENEAQQRGLEYQVELHAGVGQHTFGSASELREVFVNLIVNAVDAMPGGGNISISCAHRGERLHLQFADTGTGMPEDVQQKIFEPFFTTKGAHGTGLGLSVSHSIIERHEGSIRVDSEQGCGTVFTIYLPACEIEANAVELLPLPIAATPLSVLVIDDEDSVRETLADMLKALHHKVQIATGGQEAVRMLAAADFDLVFTDLAMPEMDGWETARAIRKRSPEMNIVLVTGYGAGTLPPAGEETLVNAIIGKPFDFPQVIQAIAEVTAQKPELEKVSA
jgi:PAS domain S-box-containing protein